MGCLQNRKHHRWARPHGYGLTIGAFKKDDDICVWCRKTRREVSLEKHKKRREEIK